MCARFAEVLLHGSAANYNLYKLVGTSRSGWGDAKTVEQSTTDKARVIATLKASYAHAKAAIRSMPDAAPGKDSRVSPPCAIPTSGPTHNAA